MTLPADKPMDRGDAEMPRLVVCAALRDSAGRVVVGPRHFDAVMMALINRMPHSKQWRGAEQGFIDQRGKFLTREEAWEIAILEGQIRRDVGSGAPCLYSENLY